MDRRELFQRIAGTAVASGIVARTSIVEAAPRPVLAVLEFSAVIDDEVVDNVAKTISELLAETELAGVRVLVLCDGARLTFLDAHGRVCNQDLRTLPDGGS